MKSLRADLKEKFISRYLEKTTPVSRARSTDINVLLNRVRAEKKSESMKKIYFSAVASTGLVLFGLLIF